MAAHFVDDRCGIVLLLFGRKSLAFIENERILLGGLFPFFWLRDRRDEFGAAPDLEDFLRRLPARIQLPVSCRTLIRGIQNWMIEKWIRHGHRKPTGK